MRNFLINHFEKAFKNIINNDDLNRRVDFMLDKEKCTNPKSFYKCILYTDLENELGKLAVDFRLRFISQQYEQAIIDGSSYEIDNLNCDFAEDIRSRIDRELIVINDYILKCILLHSQINDNDMNIVLDKLNISKIDNIHPRLEIIGDRGIYMSDNMRCYCAIHSTNFHFGVTLTKNQVESIRSLYPERILFFDKFREKYTLPLDIDLRHLEQIIS